MKMPLPSFSLIALAFAAGIALAALTGN